MPLNPTVLRPDPAWESSIRQSGRALPRLRIVHVVTMDRIRSGATTQLKRLAIDQVHKGHQVTTVFGRNDLYRDDFQEMEEQGVEVRFVDFDRFRPTRKTVRAIGRLRRLLASGRFDIIHAHKGTTLDILFFAACGLPTPIVANRGMSAPLTWRNAFKYRSPRVARIIAVAEHVKSVLVETGGIDPGKVAVVYGGVDTDVFRPGIASTLRSELGISDSARIIGNVGSLGGRKGIPELLQAFTRLQRVRDNLALVLVGATREEMARRGYLIAESITPRVYLEPFRQDVPNCLAAFDMFVFSGTRNEGLTGAVREAAAMALPIVTTDVGGNIELIRHEQEGLVVPPRDSAALFDAMLRILRNPELGRRLGMNARVAVQAKMTSARRYETIITVYREVLEAYAGARPGLRRG